ncbi:endonuclease MutS2 [Virgibacillus sp. MSP4-1]|uniref:endonuclease MutS2 n=1 Tax=Virgibacillus sp. MSP4-1 TaxID=2700081 RepID=UPI0003A828BA|nr:endonuclease MutS2 [Virgibacillus sp. MSP4-1]QHS22957.1 endonuclease MutS2 [Virgibacillus sp. MSP4-1]
MNERVLKTLEFDKIKELLTGYAGSSLGKEEASKLYPSNELPEAQRWQEETDEARQVLRLKGQIPMGGIFDIRPHVKRANIGGILTAFECLDVASTMRAGKILKQFVADIEEEELALPILRERTEQIVILNELERNIKSCIDDHGHVMDGASEKLRSIRSKIRSHENSVRDRLEQYTKSKSKMLSDAIVTIRNDRYVLPVKQEYRGSFGGIVHDQSSSGATLFIEPQSVVESNNKLQAAKVEEKQEMERILQELSAQIAEDQGFILQNTEVLQKIDFLAAKAKFSKEMDAAKPAMNDQGYIKMREARHPLIDPDEVVPNDVEIGKEYTSIVITGPNTGGKTVTLKMIGLCTLMAQSGLQVPALDGCELAVFDDVFADIGDEQSIEQSLSTFSSHMTNIVEILKGVHEKTLVLFDELGAGTDPQEGAGLAMAILDEVISRRARVIATTHYPELKAYGFNREGVMNASVEFDVKTLRPTYRLLLGVPGRSNAFEISRRLGLEEKVINQAKSLTGQDSQSVENMIASLEEARKKADEDYEQAEEILKESYQLKKELEEKWRQFEQRKEKLLEKAEQKAEKEVKKARKEAEEIIDKLQNMKNSAEIKEHELIDAKKQLSEANVNLTGNDQKQAVEQEDTKELEPGDEVKVISLNQQGSIVEKISEKEYQVQLGMMKVKAKRENLVFIKRPEPPKEEKPTTSVKGRTYHVKTELDLRGKRYEDALQELEKYVDNALLAGYPRVSIIHGKGTGALRKGVQKFAERHPSITDQRLGGMSEGGSGVTVLELG